jgi:hypothetical protein
MIDLNKTVFLVDGQTEIDAIRVRILENYYVKPQFRRVGCNGKDVTIQGYINASRGILLEVLRGSYLKIVIIVDKEKRNISASDFADKLKKAIVKEISSNTRYKKEELEEKISILVPDIMFENWIVADIEGIKQENILIKADARQDMFDGSCGAGKLESTMTCKYRKITHAPRLFRLVNFNTAQLYSPSFKLALETLGCIKIQ